MVPSGWFFLIRICKNPKRKSNNKVFQSQNFKEEIINLLNKMQIAKISFVLVGCIVCLAVCQVEEESQRSSDLNGEATNARCKLASFFFFIILWHLCELYTNMNCYLTQYLRIMIFLKYRKQIVLFWRYFEIYFLLVWST